MLISENMRSEIHDFVDDHHGCVVYVVFRNDSSTTKHRIGVVDKHNEDEIRQRIDEIDIHDGDIMELYHTTLYPKAYNVHYIDVHTNALVHAHIFRVDGFNTVMDMLSYMRYIPKLRDYGQCSIQSSSMSAPMPYNFIFGDEHFIHQLLDTILGEHEQHPLHIYVQKHRFTTNNPGTILTESVSIQSLPTCSASHTSHTGHTSLYNGQDIDGQGHKVDCGQEKTPVDVPSQCQEA